MTIREAKEIYLKSDCSYFVMCSNHYSDYIEYRKLEIPKKQETEWKNEKIQMLYTEIRRTGNPLLFQRLCEIAVKFRDYEKLLIVMYALKSIKGPLTEKQRIAISEVILGKRSLKVRSGLIYWAYDNGQRGISTLLMDLVLEYLNIPNIINIELERKQQKLRRICKRMIRELNLNFSKQYLQHYYQF